MTTNHKGEGIMKTYNIWKYDSKANSPTGGWSYIWTCESINEEYAVHRARQRYDMSGTFKAYEAL